MNNIYQQPKPSNAAASSSLVVVVNPEQGCAISALIRAQRLFAVFKFAATI